MRALIKGALAAALLSAAPAWAHGGHGHGWDGHRHHVRPGYHHGYQHHPHHRWHGLRRVEHVYRYEAYPAPQSASVAPGIHVIFPDVYIPWPR